MGQNPSTLPDAVVNLMSKEDRKALGKAGTTIAEAQAKQAAKLERELQADVLSLLSVRGVREVTEARTDKKSTLKPGTPDLTFTYHGLSIRWELKRPKEDPRVNQMEVMLGMMQDGARVSVIRSLADAIAVLDFLDEFLALLGPEFSKALAGGFVVTRPNMVGAPPKVEQIPSVQLTEDDFKAFKAKKPVRI